MAKQTTEETSGVSDKRCEFCGAPNPRWVRSLDRSVVDYAYRTIKGFPGPTSYGLHYCEDCKDAADAEYPQGNEAALRRLEAHVGRRELDADNNEVRFLALLLQREGLA